MVNRTFSAVAYSSLKSIVPTGKNPEGVVTWVDRAAVLRRFEGDGIVGPQIELWPEVERWLGDAWLAYLTFPRLR